MALGIPVLHDSITGKPVEARLVLTIDDTSVSLLRDRVRLERKTKSSRYCCGLCHDPVYLSNSGGTPHFAHYMDSGPQCAWRAELPSYLDAISAARFQGKQEGELHKRLLLTLQVLCERSAGFSEVGVPNATLFGMPGTGHRFPDLQARYDNRKLVFELQISKTYLPVISDREHFYRQNGIFLFWLFHNFDLWKGRQTERDIVAMRSRQAFELDDEAIRATLECGSLTLKAHWQVPEHDGNALTWRWMSKLVKFEELTFDEYLIEALAANPWRDEAELLAKTHAQLITKFEAYWIDRWEWTRKLSREAHQRFLDGLPVDKTRSADAVMRRGFESVLTASGMLSDMAERIYDLNFNDLLDRLFFLRDGVNKFNKQNIAGAVDTVLQHWPHYTDTLVAVAASYGHMETLRRPNVLRKISHNLKGGEYDEPVAQCHDFDRIVAMLCPKAAAWLRASAIPASEAWLGPAQVPPANHAA